MILDPRPQGQNIFHTCTIYPDSHHFNFRSVFWKHGHAKYSLATYICNLSILSELCFLLFAFVLNKNRQQHNNPVSTVPKKDIIILLPYLGLQSNQVAKRLKSCVYKFYSCVNLKIVFQSTRCIKSFFPYKDRINRSQQSRVIYRANCWDCNGFYIGKTKRRLHDRKTEHFKALAKNDNTSAIADHVKATGHNIKWDQFDILAKGKTDYHCKIKETLYIQELEPAFNVNVGSEKLMLY